MPFLPDSQMEMPEIAEGRKPVHEAELNQDHPLSPGITDMLVVYDHIRTLVPGTFPATYVRADWETRHYDIDGAAVFGDTTSAIQYESVSADMQTAWSAFTVIGSSLIFGVGLLDYGPFANNRSIGIRANNNEIRIRSRGGVHNFGTPISIVPEVLYSVGATYDSDANEIRAYLNGVRIGTQTATGTSTSNGSKFVINSTCTLAHAIHWRLRPLTDEQHKSLFENPYQMLVPR